MVHSDFYHFASADASLLHGYLPCTHKYLQNTKLLWKHRQTSAKIQQWSLNAILWGTHSLFTKNNFLLTFSTTITTQIGRKWYMTTWSCLPGPLQTHCGQRTPCSDTFSWWKHSRKTCRKERNCRNCHVSENSTYGGMSMQKVRTRSAQGAIGLRLSFSLLAPPFRYRKNRHYGICILDDCKSNIFWRRGG